MAMPDSATLWTVEMVNALPEDGQRREIIDGELFVTPRPASPHAYAATVSGGDLVGPFHRDPAIQPVPGAGGSSSSPSCT